MYQRKSDGVYMNAPMYHISGHRGLSLLKERRNFQGNTMSGGWDPYRNLSEPMFYWVMSYSTPIALWDERDQTLYRIDYTYSPTTSKHQHALWELEHYHAQYTVMCEPAWGSPDSALRCLLDAVDTYGPEA